MKYDSTFKTKVILTHATMWMNLEVIMLSETSQTQKDKRSMIPLVWGIQISQIQRQSRIRLPGIEVS